MHVAVQPLEERTLLSAGTLDPTFGQNGVVITDTFPAGRPADEAHAVAVQPDGKIVAAGGGGVGGDFTIVRYTQRGLLDPTFGNGGIVEHKIFDQGGFANGIALQDDGKIVVAGWATAMGFTGTRPAFAVVRYHTDGRLDSSFGSGGQVVTHFTQGINDAATAQAVALQSDGKIVVAGTAKIGVQHVFAIARYHRDGRLDSSFGNSGLAVADFPGSSIDRAYDVAIQPDGKIVVAGMAGVFETGETSKFAVTRLNADGSFDTSFGDLGGGVVTDFPGGNAEGRGMALLPNGRIVVAGFSGSDVALARYTARGRLDRDFGNNGRVTTDVNQTNDRAEGIVVQPDGKIVVAGTSESATSIDFALARYHADGRLDRGFGNNGRVTTNLGSSVTTSDQAKAVALQSDGKIVVAGFTAVGRRFPDIAVARYLGASPSSPPPGDGPSGPPPPSGPSSPSPPAPTPSPGTAGDYTGNRRADLAVFRTDTAEWFLQGLGAFQFGAPQRDWPLVGDFSGNRRADLAVFRTDTAQWFIQNVGAIQFGAAHTDIPVPGDYTGNGQAELAVFRPRTAEWFIRGVGVIQFGAPGLDIPVPADYTGNGQIDLAVYRPTTAQWFIRGVGAFQFGAPGLDIPVPADYTGNRRSDLAVYRPTTAQWFIQGVGAVQFGAANRDLPVPLPPAYRFWGLFQRSSASSSTVARSSITSPSPGPLSENLITTRSSPTFPPVVALPPTVSETNGRAGPHDAFPQPRRRGAAAHDPALGSLVQERAIDSRVWS